ncbi:fumarylacetoacetate hydrolase family protein [Acinetobacter sp. ANC 4173]|uniref:fumarylacetoacetate hydrolase family protein n=1 Tax=Acinetobacter sp. ANC 4173 TaxID=2529837 RepID=UPI00103FD17D|nr:fumarylacetoacetate hydrolase family protein [Acinetobacter sp. ANC 4173]TCB80415.1 FAA hydrolase family protein [Acinetobacter sp. ANC 4173]
MKLLRVGAVGHEKPAILDPDYNIRDLSQVIADINPALLAQDFADLRNIDIEQLPILSPHERIAPCVAGVGKFICIGLNYSDHAKESNTAIPNEPIIFNKWTSAISGANDQILLPRNSVKTDWEVELGIVIGREGRYICEKEALDYVAGYCVINDISEREYQLERGGSWDKGKGCDSFGPLGPWLVTKDEVPDPQQLELWLEVDGQRYQQGNTKNMIFSVVQIISYLSQFMSLQPGDIIATGTPAGVGMGQQPPKFLQHGQVVRLGIEGLGVQQQQVVESAS